MEKNIILLAENAHFMLSVLKKRLPKEFSFEINCAATMVDANKHVIDYISNEGKTSLNYLFELLHRLQAHKTSTALIV